LLREIERLRAILADAAVLMNVIVMELEDIKARFADKRRTEIVPAEAEIQVEDLIQEEDMVVTISHAGYVKRTPVSTYRAQKRGGKGKVGMEAREEDWVSQLFVASTHSYVFFFSDKGKVYVKKVYEIPEGARNAKGRAIVNFVGMEPGEKVAAITPVPRTFDDKTFVVTITKGGQIKKTALDEYENYREKGIIGVKIEEGDQLLFAAITDGSRELVIATRNGMSIRFPEEQVRPTGRATMGVKGIELDEGDRVVGLVVSSPERSRVLAVCERGFGKQTPLGGVPPPEPRRQGRHPDRRERAQRPRRRRRHGRPDRQRAPRHRSRADAPHDGLRDPRDEPQRPGRPAHGRRGGGAHRRDRDLRRRLRAAGHLLVPAAQRRSRVRAALERHERRRQHPARHPHRLRRSPARSLISRRS
jgi:DNA gyrase/topoisomerase IV subunit A